MDNLGDLMLVDVSRNCVVGGSRFDWTADDVISYCRELQASKNSQHWEPPAGVVSRRAVLSFSSVVSSSRNSYSPRSRRFGAGNGVVGAKFGARRC